jgi:hypothetical protein
MSEMGGNYRVVLVKEDSSFVKRYRRLFGIIGSGIVLATFIVREGMRERLRDQSDALSNARTYSSLAQSIDQVSQQLNVVTAMAHKASVQTPQANLGKLSEDDFDDYSKSLTRFNEDATTFGKYIDGLQCNNTDRADFEKVKSNVEQIKHQTGDVQIFRDHRLTQIGYDGEYYSPDSANIDINTTHAITKKLQSANHEIRQAEHTLLNMESSCSDAAQIALRTTEDHYKCATKASYVLYGTGWLLGLLGQIYGKGNEAESGS